MKLSLPSLLCALAAGLALLPAVSRAQYQPADRALNKLENVVTLTPDQQRQALKIFEDLKVVMDSMDPAERPQKGAQSRRDAMAAIRSILTPEQQAIYDSTPVRLGGGNPRVDAPMQALNQKIRLFVMNQAQTSPKIAAEVGTVQKVVLVQTGSMTRSNGDQVDPNLHPDGGLNPVKVTGSTATKTFNISWDMSAAGEMTVTKVEAIN